MFTGLFDLKRPGEYPHLVLDGEAEELRDGRPPAERMRREVSFGELPEEARRGVMRIYRELWNIGGD